MKKLSFCSLQRVSSLSIGLSLSCTLALSGCDAPQGAQPSQREESGNQAAQAQGSSPTTPGAVVQPEAKHKNQASRTGPDYIKTNYDPKVQLGGLYTFDQLDIPTHDGVTLEALVTEPAKAGKYPLIVMPASWTLNRHEYEVPARQWASQGFVVISYTSRGFHGSGGKIDISGPPTVKDVSSMIDWAEKNTKADIDRVGALGLSYGGGASLLAAAQDSRIDAVVSMSGWTDLRFSNFPNDTPSGQSGDFLVNAAEASGRRGPVMNQIDQHIKDGDFESALELFDARSPIKKIDAINDNEAAVMIAQAWNDGVFPPRQALSFFEKLRGDKRLLLQPGSHGSADGAGIAGLPDSTWKLSLEWMRKHVAGEDLVQGPPVIVVSNDNKWVSTAASVEDWRADKKTFNLGSPRGEGPIWRYGAMTPLQVFGWQHSIEGGHDTVAQSGLILVSGALNGLIGLPQVINTTTVNRKHAAVWKSEPILRSHNISGAPSIQVNVTSPEKAATMVAYLYESVAGVASLVTYAPVSVRDLDPGKPTLVKFDLEPTQWNVVPGARLVLVIDTVDKRYHSETQEGQEIGFSSSVGSPARIEVPMRLAL